MNIAPLFRPCQGVPTNKVKGKVLTGAGIAYISLSMHPYAKELAKWRRRRDQIRRWQALGMSLAEIGRKLGVSRQRVAQLVKTP